MYCFKIFNVASQYIAYADTHKDAADITKNSYTRQIYDRLREIAAEKLGEYQLKVETKKRTRELAGTQDARRVKGKLDNAITSLLPSYFPRFTGINSLTSNEASLQLVLASALYPNSIGALVPIETLDKYGAPIF